MDRERRTRQRVKLPVSLKYWVEGEGGAAFRLGELVDFSAGGLRFASDMPLEAGARVQFELLLQNRPTPYHFLGEVVWSRRSQAGIEECGVMFVDVTPAQEVELEELVEFLVKGLLRQNTRDASHGG